MRRLLLLALLLLVAACGDDETPVVTAPDPEQRYRIASVTVLESPDHGPQLCLGGVAESYPPQCGGIAIDGLSWSDVPGAESASGTTWATVSVTGTYDGERFAVDGVAEPEPFEGRDHDFTPICDDYDAGAGAAPLAADLSDIDGVAAVWVSDPSGDWDGPFVVNVIARPGTGDDVRAAVEERWDGALCVEERDQPTEAELSEIAAELTGDDVPFDVVYASSDVLRGVVVATVVVLDDAGRQHAEDRWGDLVELEPLLVPIA